MLYEADDSSNLKLVYLKSGIAIGGASIADMELLQMLKHVGFNPRVVSGIVEDGMHRQLQKKGLKTSVYPVLDREKITPADRDDVRKIITDVTVGAQIFMISQAFCGDNPVLDSVLADVLTASFEPRVLFRSHNISKNNPSLSLVGAKAAALTVNSQISRDIHQANPEISTLVFPPFINQERLVSTSNPAEVRAHWGIAKHDFVLFQPTRVDADKNVAKAIDLASKLQAKLPDRKVFLMVAGGNESKLAAQAEKDKLLGISDRRQFTGLIFMNGLYGNEKYRRVSDYMNPGVVDAITFMSSHESFGMPLLEGSLAGIPCVTRKFCGLEGNDTSGEVFSGFNFCNDESADPDQVDPGVVDWLAHLARHPGSFDAELETNRALSAKYLPQSVKGILVEALSNLLAGPDYSKLIPNLKQSVSRAA